MREFESTFKDGLRKGLRTDIDNPRNNEFLVDALNMRCMPSGIRPSVLPTRILSDLVSWPYPQIFIGSDYRIVATEDTIYEADSDWNLTAKATVIAGDRWDFIDFGLYFVLTNGTQMVTSLRGSYSVLDSVGGPRFSTGCNFKGQIIAGNIKTNWHDCGVNSVIWSVIGSHSFHISPSGEFILAEDDSIITSEDGVSMFSEGGVQSATAGYRHMYWEGSILRILRLRDIAVVYGSNGIALMVPKGAAYGMSEVSDIGILSRDAVDGDYNTHVFVDSDRYIWRVIAGNVPERLGYKEFIGDLDSTLVVSYDKSRKEFYIGDSSTCYLLTESGLTRLGYFVTSIAGNNGTSFSSYLQDDIRSVTIVTDIIDFGIRGLKTISSIELGANFSGDIQMAIDYRYDKKKPFVRSRWENTGLEGVVTIPVTALEFRLCIRTLGTAVEAEDGSDIEAEDGTSIRVELSRDLDLDYINIKVKLSDRRFIRGPRTSDIRHNTERTV